MRIIGGEFRSRKIERPSFDVARPTKDRVREAVFSIIAARLEGARILDVFAGSGAYGLEALSRGAKSCIFVEKHVECTGIISSNIKKLGVVEKTKIRKRDVFECLEDLGRKGEKFDIIFSDPPYGLDITKNILIMIERYDILSDFGLLVAEHDSKEEIPEGVGTVSIYKQKTYGISSISVFLKR